MDGIEQLDSKGNIVPAHVTDPLKCHGTLAAPLAAGTLLKKSPTAGEIAAGAIDIAGWLDVVIYPTTDGYITYNADATKQEPVIAGMANVFLIHPNLTQIVPSVTFTLCGM